MKSISAALVFFVVLSVFVSSCTGCLEEPIAQKEKRKDLSKALIEDAPKATKEDLQKYMPESSPGSTFVARDFTKAAKAAIQKSDYEAACTLASKAIALAPGDGHAYFIRGKAEINSFNEKSEAALSDLQKAVDLGPGDITAYEYLARAYDLRGAPQKAIQALSMGIASQPDAKNFYKNRAALYNASGQAALAENDYNQFVKLGSAKHHCYLVRAQFYEQKKRYKEAIKDYSTVIERFFSGLSQERQVLVLKNRALLYSTLGRHRETIADLSRAMKVDSKDDETICLRATQYLEMGQAQQAIGDFSLAVKICPDSARAYEGRANVYDRLGKSALAQKDRQQAKLLKAAPAELPI